MAVDHVTFIFVIYFKWRQNNYSFVFSHLGNKYDISDDAESSY